MKGTHIVLLSGGSGTRLWPLSNSARSKQFLKVLRDEGGNHESMVQRTFRKLCAALSDASVTVATGEEQVQPLRMQVEGDYDIVAEPERRDTAPAIMLACAHLADVRKVNPDDIVVVMPIDAYAEDSYYMKVAQMSEAVQGGRADLVLLGVKPSYPSEKYGYIVPEHESGGVAVPVAHFKEKPTVGQAAGLIGQGALWNCGVFAFRLGYLMNILEGYVEDASFEAVLANYSSLPKNSFDYEVVEKADSVAVVSFSRTWKDLGTWNTLSEEMVEASSGRVVGIEGCENTHVVNELGIPVVVSGLEHTVVAATPDGILVATKDASSHIKPLVEKAQESRAMYERRRWGEYRVLDVGTYPDGAKSLTKELVIEAGCQLSYQRHAHRSEVWTVVSGRGEVVLDGVVNPVSAGNTISVQKDRRHAVRAFEDLHAIEVQVGDLLEEGDIERFGNWWEDWNGESE